MTIDELRKATLFLLNLAEQNLQLTNMQLHAVHKPAFDEHRSKLGGPYQPAAVGSVPYAYVPNGPGCAACQRTPAELIEKGHGPHAES